MSTEAKDRKPRVVTPRHPLHQACLDAMHEWVKNPFADKRDAVLAAMLEFKRYKYADPNITVL